MEPWWMNVPHCWLTYIQTLKPCSCIAPSIFLSDFFSYLLLSHWQTTVVSLPLCHCYLHFVSLLSRSLPAFFQIWGRVKNRWEGQIYILTGKIDLNSPSANWWSNNSNYYRAWNCVRSISAINDGTNLKPTSLQMYYKYIAASTVNTCFLKPELCPKYVTTIAK